MKSSILEFLFFSIILLLLCGLQSSFYLLPLPAPALWFVVFCYYSYNRPLLSALILNLLLTILLLNFSVGNGGILLATLNFSTLIMKVIKNRLHIGNMQITVTVGFGCFLFFFFLWGVNRFFYGVYYPHILAWTSTSIITFLVTPFIIIPLNKIERIFLTDSSQSLEDLRI